MIQRIASCSLFCFFWVAIAQGENVDQWLNSLASDTASIQEKARACQRLGEAGETRAVPALAKLVEDPVFNAYARAALERIPGKEVDEVLLASLRPKGLAAVGVVQSLERRGATGAASALAPLAEGDDEALAAAALRALGTLGSEQHERTILRPVLEKSASTERREAAAAGMLRRAERHYREGRASQGQALCMAVAEHAPKPFQLAAFRRIMFSSDSFQPCLDYLRSSDSEVSDLALLVIRERPSEKLTDRLHRLFEVSEGGFQVKLAWALGDMPNEATVGVLAGQLDVDSPELLAAVRENLARLGGEQALAALLAHWAGGATVDALVAMRGPGIDGALAHSLELEQGTDRRLGLIEVLGRRGAPQAREVLLVQANSVLPDIRVASLRALRPMARSADIPALVDQYKQSANEARAAAFAALATACRRGELTEDVGSLLVDEFRRAREAEARQNWARLLIAVGDDASLPVLAGRLLATPKDPATAEGIALLKRWPGLAAAPYLKPLCHDGAHGPAALDAMLHLIAGSDDVRGRLKWLRATQGLAVTTQQKRAYLAAVGGTKDPSVATLLKPYEGDAEVREELEAARKALRDGNR